MATGVEEILIKFGEDIVESLNRNLPEKSDSTGSLRDSIHFEIKVGDDKFTFQLKLNDYYIYVNDGRKKGAKLPPFEPINKWVTNKRLKLFTGKTGKRGGKIRKSISAFKPSDRKVFIEKIRWGIKLKGIKPTKFYDRSVTDSVIRNLKLDLIKATQKAIVVTIKET
jgi:hypothetical protein